MSIRIGIFGDMGCESAQIDTVIYSDPFKHIHKWLNTLDYKVANLETTFSGYESDYPKFSSSDIFARYLREKFNLLFTANNHSYDGGLSGVIRTIEILQKYDIPNIGTGVPGSPQIYHSDILKGHRLGFINYVTSVNGEKSKQADGIFADVDPEKVPEGAINFYSETQIKKEIALASTWSQLIISGIHQRDIKKVKEFGHEATKEQIQQLEQVLDFGSTIVLGGHPHDFQGGRIYSDDRLVVYSLGNFYSCMTNKKYPVNSGCALVITLEGGSKRYSFLPLCTCKVGKFYYVFPMSQVHLGMYPISKEQIELVSQKLQKIRQILTECSLEEEIVPAELL
jgi:poly-gamma-glutamate synthesis protein (capsule biosynthesis protein)